MKIIEQNIKQLYPSSDFECGDAILDITASGRYFRTSRLLRIDLIRRNESRHNESRRNESRRNESRRNESRRNESRRNESGVRLISWISEQESDEYEMLTALSDALDSIRRIITFNGNAFDLPHLHQKYKAFDLMDPLQGKQYLDLMLRLKPISRFLALPSGKLADFAGFLHLAQPDASDEASFRFHPGAEDKHEASTPNDALYTLECMSLLHYADFLDQGARIREVTTDEERVIFRLHYPDGFPVGFSVHDSGFHLRFSEDGTVLLSSRICNGSIRYYHTDVKNYWYLPLEGYAIHKSAAQYVDKSRREKAVRENCYHLVSVSPAFLQDPAMLDGYLKSVLAYFATYGS